MVRALAVGFVLAALAGACAGSRGPAPAGLDAARAGGPGAPSPEVRLLDGRPVLWSSLLGAEDHTLAVFATTWCAVCRAEEPAVEEWARAHPSIPVLYVFSGDGLPAVASAVAERGMGAGPVTVVVDGDGGLADRYSVTATPTLLVLDREGRAREVHHHIRDVKAGPGPEP